jgi:hypothetical protein
VLRATQDRGDVVAVALASADDGLLHAFNGVISEELQDTNEMAGAGLGTVLLFQGQTQVAEYGRQLPLAVDIGVIESRRLAPECHQVMQRIKDLHPWCVRARVMSDDLTAGHDLDMMHVTFDGHGLERKATRHAVAVPIEAHRLILVHLGRLPDGGVERSRRQRQGLGPVASEAFANGLLLAYLRTRAIAQTTGAEVGIQLGKVLALWDGRCPILLQELHATFDAWLLLRPPDQAEQRLEVVMARQGKVTLVDLPAAAFE